MIGRRVLVNLAAFLGLFALLAWWALGNVFEIDAIEQPYRVEAAFETSPGLRPNVETTYLGVPVGTVRSVELVDDHVNVSLAIDRDVDLPVGMSAAIRRKSAVGEPYVALEPSLGEASSELASDGYRIPLDRTSVPLSYGELFESVDELVSSVPEDDFAVVLGELATALRGRGDDIRRLLVSAENATSTLATREEVFGDLAEDITSLTATLTDQREGIGSSFDDLSALSSELRSEIDTIEGLLADAPGFGQRVDRLLDDTYADLSCAFDDTGSVFTEIGTDDNIDRIIRLLLASDFARDALDLALVETGEDGADGPYLEASFGLVPEESPPVYGTPRTLPDPPPLAACLADGPTAEDRGEDAGASSEGDGGEAPGGDELAVPGRPGPTTTEVADTTDASTGSDPFPIGPAVITLGVLLSAAIVAALRPWRWLAAVVRRDDDGSP